MSNKNVKVECSMYHSFSLIEEVWAWLFIVEMLGTGELEQKYRTKVELSIGAFAEDLKSSLDLWPLIIPWIDFQ